VERAAKIPRLHALIVVRDGETWIERRLRGPGLERPVNIKSAAKSVLSALAGIAIDKGILESVDQPVVDVLGERVPADVDPRVAKITVGNLLSMQAGLASTSGAQYGKWVTSPNWVRHVLRQPFATEPGGWMVYSSGTSHLLSAALTAAAGRSTLALARDWLGQPLNIQIPAWQQDPQGIYFGGNEMLLTPAQMVMVGELWRNRGRVDTRQVVTEAWVAASCTPRTRSVWDPTREYGYGWWIQTIGGQRACFAWGFGGQYILVFPSLDLVVTATSSTTVSEDRHGHRSALFDLLRREVIEPLAR
jgi:CubicO group peptidase (beta-lactamase class C family)